MLECKIKYKKLYCFLFRNLTDRQKALLMSYAEDEAGVEGTVNGVTATTTGTETLSCHI